MLDIQEIDTVLQQVRRLARQFRLSEDTSITQQILLFGDAFYGYRFNASNFTAVWSAGDQTLKMFDHLNQILGTFQVPLDDMAWTFGEVAALPGKAA